QHLADGLGRGDEAVDLAVFPARKRILLEMKIDASGGDEGLDAQRLSASGRRGDREAERRHGDAVWIVRVYDVRPGSPEHPREAPRRTQVEFSARSEWDEIESFFGAPPQLAVWVRDERGAMPDRPQPIDGQEDLILSAAPGASCVDVNREHYVGSGFR